MVESTLHEQLEHRVCASAEACLGLDADGEIRACNSPAAELLDGSRQDLRGRPITAFIPALPLRRNTTGYNLAYIGLWYANGERRPLIGVRPDGRALPLEIAVNVLKQEKSISYLVGMQPAATEPDLGQRMRELEQSLDGAAEAAMITNLDGIIEYVNSAFEALAGFTREEAVGRSPAILKSGAHSRDFYAALWKTLGAGKSYHGLLVNRRKDGTILYENLMIRPFADHRGTATHFVALGTDAGERVEAAQRVIKVEMLRAPAATHIPTSGMPGCGS